MPFRARLKKAFGGSDADALSKAVSKRDEKARKKDKSEDFANWPEHIYKPHEMPKPKYRRTPEKSHTQALEAYSWGENGAQDAQEVSSPTTRDSPKSGGGIINALRRKSGTSQYSPMGSRLPSRSSSIIPKLGPSKPPSRTHSLAKDGAVVEEDEGLSRVKSNTSSRRPHSVRSSRPTTAGATAVAAIPPSSAGLVAPPAHEPIHEHSSAEQSRASPGTASQEVSTRRNRDSTQNSDVLNEHTQNSDALNEHTQDGDDDDDGGELEHTATLRPLDRTTTAIQDRPFSGAELVHALTAIQVEREPAAVAA